MIDIPRFLQALKAIHTESHRVESRLPRPAGHARGLYLKSPTIEPQVATSAPPQKAKEAWTLPASPLENTQNKAMHAEESGKQLEPEVDSDALVKLRSCSNTVCRGTGAPYHFLLAGNLASHRMVECSILIIIRAQRSGFTLDSLELRTTCSRRHPGL
jgi:hypothetical protein